jgi:type I restriction enzyme, S subunit
MQKLQKNDKTEIGEIPKDWKVSTIGELASVDGGYAFSSNDYVDEGVRLLRITNVSFGRIDLQDTIWLPKSYLAEYSKFSLKEGDIVIVLTRPIIEGGIKAARIDKQHLPLLLNQRIGKFNIKYNKKLDKNFLFHLIFSERFIQFVKQRASVTNQPNISPFDIEKFSMHLPDIEEQQRISYILMLVDNLIQKTDQIIERTQRLRNGLMQRLLTKGIGHIKFKKTKLGLVPEDWRILTLVDVSVNGIRNGLFKKREDYGNGVPLVNVSDLFSNHDIDIHKLERVKVNKDELKQFHVEEGDLFFCRSSLVAVGIGKSNTVSYLPEPTVFECHVMMIRPNKNIVDPKFLSYYTRSPFVKKFLFSIAMTLTMTTIRQPDLERLPVPLPSLSEQQKIASILSKVDGKIEKLTTQKNNYELQKKGLMQQLLTGKIRIRA